MPKTKNNNLYWFLKNNYYNSTIKNFLPFS